MVPDFDPALLQLAYIGLAVFDVVRNETDLAAKLDQQLQHGQHANRT